MNKRFPHGIDITAPGGITALMDFHRLTFGDAVMEDDPDAAAKAAEEAAAKAAAEAAGKGGDDDEKLRDPGIKALKAEREAREAAEKRAAAAEAKIKEAEDAKLSDIERANQKAAEAEERARKLETSNARLSALAKHPVPEEYQDLVTGTDEASYLASAKKISELYAKAEGKAPKNDPVPGSGKRGDGGGNAAGGSLAAGRELYEKKHKKNS